MIHMVDRNRAALMASCTKRRRPSRPACQMPREHQAEIAIRAARAAIEARRGHELRA